MNALVDRSSLYERRERTVKRATAYVKKAADWLVMVDNDRQRIDLPLSPTYWTLLLTSIEAAEAIVEHLDDDFFKEIEAQSLIGPGTFKHNLSDDHLEAAERLVEALKARRKRADTLRVIERLEDVSGREPEEAETYLAKAREMRERLGNR